MVTDGITASQLSGGALSSSSTSSSTQGPSAASARRFEEAHSRAVAHMESGASGPMGATAHTAHSAQVGAAAQSGRNSLATLLDPLLNLNSSSTRLAERSGRTALADMKPSELMMLTMRSQEFLFNCQLVANVANRSSDGVQQLFRQQS